MQKIISALVVTALSLQLMSCADLSKQDVGTVGGAVAGGLLGSRFGSGSGQLLAVGVGSLAGAFLGGAIGKSMDDADRMKMSNALEYNSVGQPAYWRNPNNNTSYTVVPTKNVSVRGNPYCREYRTTADIAGKKQQIYGTACRQADGSWKTVS